MEHLSIQELHQRLAGFGFIVVVLPEGSLWRARGFSRGRLSPDVEAHGPTETEALRALLKHVLQLAEE